MSRRGTRQWLAGQAAAQWRLLLPAMIGGLVRQIGFLAVPPLLQLAIDDGIAAGDPAAASVWAGALLAAAVLQFLGLAAWDYYANLADARAGSRLRSAVLDRLLRDRGRGKVGGDGDLVLRAGRDVDAVRVWIHGLPTWIVIGTTALVLVPGLFALDPWLLAVAVGTAPLLVMINRHYTRAYEHAGAELARAHGARADAVEHLLRSGVTTRGLGAEELVRDRHHLRSAELTGRAVRSGTVLARWSALGEGVPTVAVAIGIAVGAYAVLDGRLSTGGLVAFAGWMATLGIAVQVGLVRLSQTVGARVAAERLQEVLDAPSVLGSRGRAAGPFPDGDLPGQAELRLDDVVVFPGGPTRSMSFRPGELVVLTGPTGVGKSSLLRVLAGWQSPVAGQVTYAGAPVADLPPDLLTLVPQRPLALADTVAVNLGLGAEMPEPRLLAALAGAGLLRDEPDGLWFELGDHRAAAAGLGHRLADGTASLSGGQIQRLALARAFVAQPVVLLVDDVTSAVDVITEELIVAELRRLAVDRIVVVCSHRVAMLESADRVVAL